MPYEEDIPFATAQRAHAATSMVPHQRARQVRADYSDTLAADREALFRHATTTDKKDLLEVEFATYRTGYRKRYLAWLDAMSRTMSPMVTGPANFPVRRNQKACDVEHRRLEELVAFRERALAAIKKKLRPELRPVMAGDDDAVERLEEKIRNAEADQERMKRVNRAHKAYLKDASGPWNDGLSDVEQRIVRSYEPEYSWEPHPFPPYALQNNNANIRRMQKRLDAIRQAKGTRATAVQGALARVEDVPADNRVRVYFPDKPSADVRARLKKAGFRWAPSLEGKPWQAYRNPLTIQAAHDVAQVPGQGHA